MGGGPSAADMAAKAKAEQDQKRKYCKDNGYPASVPFCAAFKEAQQKCDQAKAYIPIEQTECKADASAFGNNMSVQICSSDNASGVFNYEFNYHGDYFKSRTAYPPASYTTGAQCKQLANSAISYYQSYCSTNGDRQKLTSCAGVE
jgi:hypothetical protein